MIVAAFAPYIYRVQNRYINSCSVLWFQLIMNSQFMQELLYNNKSPLISRRTLQIERLLFVH